MTLRKPEIDEFLESLLHLLAGSDNDDIDKALARWVREDVITNEFRGLVIKQVLDEFADAQNYKGLLTLVKTLNDHNSDWPRDYLDDEDRQNVADILVDVFLEHELKELDEQIIASLSKIPLEAVKRLKERDIEIEDDDMWDFINDLIRAILDP